MRSIRIFSGTFCILGNATLGAWFLLTALYSLALAADHHHRSNGLVPRDFLEGKQLFEKCWVPGQPSPIGGDGLGPLYNEDSCIGCHHLGGTGGAGPTDRNVMLLTAVPGSARSLARATVFQGELEDLHPGFRNRASIVLHRHATIAKVDDRLKKIESYTAVQTREEIKVLRKGQRNTPALFGVGLMDQIPDTVLREAEKRSFPGFPEIQGRVSQLPDGRLGRFGWKAQVSSLDDFVRAACSNELGLEVPGHHQPSLATAKEFDPSRVRLDMDEDQCELLTRFVSRLAPPVRRPADNGSGPPWGFMVFQSIGCATCHAPTLGSVRGLYSDLLLHDMGESSADAAVYYGSPVAPRSLGDLADAREQSRRTGTAAPTEWRTPPLWGVASSAPYLHDGRAQTLDSAIRFHDGEAAKTKTRYNRLSSGDRGALLSFLNSLTVSPSPRKSAAGPRKRARAA
jgi:CxxC motif-containing protein (DUF1111 family)